MNANSKMNSNSDIYARIDALPLSASARSEALQSLRNGEAIADAILRAYSGLKNLFQGATLKHGLRH